MFDHLLFTLIHGSNIPGSCAILFFPALDFTFTTRHIHMLRKIESRRRGQQRIKEDLVLKTRNHYENNFGEKMFPSFHLKPQFSSVAQSCPTLCDRMDYSLPGFPVCHQLPELAQTHVHWVGEAIQPSHPLSSPSPPAFNLSQHQRLFRWVSSSHQVLKYWNFSFRISSSNEYSGLISFRIDWFDWLSKGLSRVFSNTTVQKHQFFGTQLSLWSNSHIHM